jgi:tRNA dimethylallyltransferase
VSSGGTANEEQLRQLFSFTPLPLKEKDPTKTKRKKVIAIAGPTAVGKTEISISIAKAMGGEVISADSMQVYRGMDIGTAKPSVDMRRQVNHHLIDSRDLDENYNVVDFYREAMQALKEIFSQEKVPLVVGGTGFYIQALLYGPPSGPPAAPQIRDLLETELEKHGSQKLLDLLYEKDPDYAKTITSNDRHKIVRALEIIQVTNRKVSDFLPAFHREEAESCDFRCWFLYLPKEVVYKRIEKRCDAMIEQGLIEEVKRLIKEGLAENKTASQAIGYRQCLDYLKTPQTEDDFKTFLQAFKQASRRYAKRQYTWFRKQPMFRWLNLASISREAVIELIIQDYEQSF